MVILRNIPLVQLLMLGLCLKRVTKAIQLLSGLINENNKHFFVAKANKNDEFYTKLEDIESG